MFRNLLSAQTQSQKLVCDTSATFSIIHSETQEHKPCAWETQCSSWEPTVMFKNPNVMLRNTNLCLGNTMFFFGNPLLCLGTQCYAHRNTNLRKGIQRSVWEPNVIFRNLMLMFRNPNLCLGTQRSVLGTQYYFQEPYVIFRNPNFPVLTEEARGRYSGLVDWSPYDPTYKKYLQIGKHCSFIKRRNRPFQNLFTILLINKLCII